ncbi:MAG: XRE family transcriptional regulator [Nitrospinae bacterium]|nr:XRE family transcriptional regulator [Nitrospinota bacterium]
MKARMSKSSGNVFLDAGFSREEAENLRIRSSLMMELERYIVREKLTQAGAARIFGVTQPRISDLKRGKINLFSVDALITMLSRAGHKVDVKVKKPRAA